MDSWLTSSLLSLLLYALWAVSSKQSQTMGKLSPIESQVTTVLTMFVLSLTTVYTNRDAIRAPNDLPILGVSLAFAAGLLTYTAGTFYSSALTTGSGSVVAAISGSYPAVAFVINVAVGWESVSGWKLAGLACAVASTACFSMA